MSSESTTVRQVPIVCPGHTRPLAELQFIRLPEDVGGTVLLSACHDRRPMLRDGVTGDWIGTLAGHKGAVWSCAMDDSASLAASASGDFSARLWDAVTGQSLVELPHKHIVKTCAFSPRSDRLATGGKEALLRVYHLPTILMNVGVKDNSNNNSRKGKSRLGQGGGSGVPTETRVEFEIPQESAITKLVWVTDQLLLCACANGSVYIWDIPPHSSSPNAVQQPLHTLVVNEGSEIRDMELVRLASKKQSVLTIASGTMVYFFDVTSLDSASPSPSAISLLHAHKMPIHFREEGGASLHPGDGNRFIVGGSDLWVRVFDTATGKELECHRGHHGPVRCVRYAPDGATYATGSEDGTIRIWMTEPDEESIVAKVTSSVTTTSQPSAPISYAKAAATAS